MRILFVLPLVAVLLGPVAAAQSFEFVGARAGVTAASVDTPNPAYGATLGFVASASVGFSLTPDLLAIVELEYGHRGYTLTTPDGAESGAGRLYFLSLPALVRLELPIGRGSDFFVATGPRFDFLLGGDPVHVSLQDGTPFPDDVAEQSETGLGGGISLAGGFQMLGLVGRSLGLEVRYILGLTDLTPDLFIQTSLRGFDLTLQVSF